jgi:hypothetical protein
VAQLRMHRTNAGIRPTPPRTRGKQRIRRLVAFPANSRPCPYRKLLGVSFENNYAYTKEGNTFMSKDIQRLDNHSISNENIPPKSQKSNKIFWKSLGTIIVLTCVISILYIAFVTIEKRRVAAEKAQIESVLDSYMKSMLSRNYQSAYALFSPSAQEQLSVSDINGGDDFFLFQEYKSLSVENMQIDTYESTNSDGLPITAATVDGTIFFYHDTYVGKFDGIIEKVGELWKIHSISLSCCALIQQ